MERLTNKDTLKVAFDAWELCGLDKTCKRDCFGPEPCKIPKIVRKLAKYEDKEENRTLIKLPCKVGTPYYTVSKTCSDGGYHIKGEYFPYDTDCDGCCVDCDKEYVIRERKFNTIIDILQKKKYIGKTIFLTKEEADEQARQLLGEQASTIAVKKQKQKKARTYCFNVFINGVKSRNPIAVKANNKQDAYNVAMDTVETSMKRFPSWLDIDSYAIELSEKSKNRKE